MTDPALFLEQKTFVDYFSCPKKEEVEHHPSDLQNGDTHDYEETKNKNYFDQLLNQSDAYDMECPMNFNDSAADTDHGQRGQVFQNLENLRHRVNQEIDQFYDALNGVLDEHQIQMHSFINVTELKTEKDGTETIPHNSNGEFQCVPCVGSNKTSPGEKVVTLDCSEHNEKNKLLLQMLSVSTSISRALRRKEFQI